MSFRIFNRKVWQPAEGYPNGYKPLATPADSCQTIITVNTRDEALEYCEERNAIWRKAKGRIDNATASSAAIHRYYTSPRYEFTQI